MTMRLFLCLCLSACVASMCGGGEVAGDTALPKDGAAQTLPGGNGKEAVKTESPLADRKHARADNPAAEAPAEAGPDSVGADRAVDIQPPPNPNGDKPPLSPQPESPVPSAQADWFTLMLDKGWPVAVIGAILLAVCVLLLAHWIRTRGKRLPVPTAPFVFPAKGMRTAFFGDIHGNHPALRAVIEDMAKQSVDRMVCLGDLVGYGAEPDECVDLVRTLRCPTILGNHDHFMIASDDMEKMNPIAAMSVEWTRNHLRPDNVEFIRRLGLTHVAGDATAVHADPRHPGKWDYILKDEAAAEAMALQRTQLCVIGHSHVPALYRRIGGEVRSLTVEPFFRVKLHPESLYLANAGSVGQPRDRQSKSCWLLHDAKTGEIEFRFVAYDVRAAQERIRAAGLPEKNAARLESGT